MPSICCVAQGLQQRVRDPVDRLGRPPGDEAQPVAVVEELVLAAPHGDRLARVVEDRRRLPARPLDAVVLPVAPGRHDEPVRAVVVAAAVGDRVRARRLGVRDVARAERGERRVVDREADPRADDDRLVLGDPRVVEEAREARRARLAPALAARALGVARARRRLAPRSARPARGRELPDGLADLPGRRRHVARADLGAEVDLLDRVLRRLVGELDEPEDGPLVGDVRDRVLAEDAQQRLARAEELADAELVLGLAEEVLLARGPDEVVVEVAVADVVQGVGAAELLVAGRDVDRRVVRPAPVGRAVVVEVAPVDVGVHAAEPVDRPAKAAEVHVDDVVDRDAEHVAQGADGERRAADLERGVDLVGDGAVLRRDLHLEVARDRHDRRDAPARVQAQEDDRVRAGRALRRDVGEAAVRAEQEDRLRAALGDVGEERAVDPVRTRGQDPLDVVLDLEDDGGRDGPRGRQHDEQRRERGALEDRPADARRRRGLLDGAHASPPSTARSGDPCASAAGSAPKKSPRARR